MTQKKERVKLAKKLRKLYSLSFVDSLRAAKKDDYSLFHLEEMYNLKHVQVVHSEMEYSDYLGHYLYSIIRNTKTEQYHELINGYYEKTLSPEKANAYVLMAIKNSLQTEQNKLLGNRNKFSEKSKSASMTR